MIEVHLIGYTADLRHLVLDVDANEERGRYRLVVDGDLFATLDDVRQQRWELGLDVGVWQPEDEWDELDEADQDDQGDEVAAAEPEPALAPLAVEEPAKPDPSGDDEAWEDDDDLGDDLIFEDEIRPLADAPASDGDDATEVDDHDPELAALLERVSADSVDEAPAVRVVPAPPPPPIEEPSEVEAAWDGGSDDPDQAVALDDDDVEYEWTDDDEESEEAVAPLDVVDDREWEEASAAEVVDPDALAAEAAKDVAVLDSDIPRPRPTALPSQLAKRHTAEGLEIPSDAKLSPAEIQAELRKGRSVRAVAKAAGTDPAWVKRWLEPIQAEQTRIVEQAQRMTVVSRKGQVSALPLAEAVEVRLGRRNVDPESASWDAVRRDDGTWKVSCRFEEKGKARTASWLWARGEARLSPASELAREVGWVDRRLARSR